MSVMKTVDDPIKRAAALLLKAKSILFITGAGISADSGLPTYRGAGGLYNDSDTQDGVSIEVALAGETLKTNPALTWKYLSQIEERCRNARYNRAHEVIAKIEKHFSRVWVLTQNIDGFHKDAGSKNVIEIHGNMHRLFCEACGWKAEVKNYSEIKIPPECPDCGEDVRPEVVFFGEALPYREMKTIFDEMYKGFDLYFSIGTTTVFPYIQRPIQIAKEACKPIIEINPSETEVSHLADIKISGSAAKSLDLIWKCFMRGK